MRKLVVVNEKGVIPELNNIMGPITYPTRITIKAIAEMIKHKKEVLECDPGDPHDNSLRIKLTMENLKSNNFPKLEYPKETLESDKKENVLPTDNTGNMDNDENDNNINHSDDENLNDNDDANNETENVNLSGEENKELVTENTQKNNNQGNYQNNKWSNKNNKNGNNKNKKK